MKKFFGYVAMAAMIVVGVGCTPKGEVEQSRLVVLDPGHFHASLLQKNELPAFAPTVAVYAPEGAELEQYVGFVESYNCRTENPTHWVLDTYAGEDYLDRMVAEHKGDVVVLAGNNRKKTQYIYAAVEAGYNVLADKPMAISTDDYTLLKKAYTLAAEKGLVIYEMMTERYDVKNILEKKILANEALFGTLTQGTPEEPAVYQESVHHFCKMVSGKPSVRPAWYYDVEQQGEGIADVTTHLIDQVAWQCFPEESVRVEDVAVVSAEHWPTRITAAQYEQSTGRKEWPEYLLKDVKRGVLNVNANGVINSVMKGVCVQMKVVWNFVAPQGSGDTSTSVKKGTKATVMQLQNVDNGYVKTLYVEPAQGVDVEAFKAALTAFEQELQEEMPGVSFVEETEGRYRANIPKEMYLAHEDHFGKVAEAFLGYKNGKELPQWEVDNTLSKYYITTEAVRVANK